VLALVHDEGDARIDAMPCRRAARAEERNVMSEPALVVVDMQRYFCERGSVLERFISSALPDGAEWYFESLQRVIVPNIRQLIGTFRSRALPIIFTEFGSHTADGRDLPPWARRMNDRSVAALGERCFPPLSDPAARVIDELRPSVGEEVFGKATSGPLAGTRIDAHLAALKADPVVVTGVMTDICVTGMTRELADCGFDVVLASDACSTFVKHSHEWSIQLLGASFATAAETEKIIGDLVNR
jgi:nicotinamidase-related amidase